MELFETSIDGLFLIKHKIFTDNRGLFIKTYNHRMFEQLGIAVDIKERYFSISHKNVIRGMHFQIPPQGHVKLVTVMQGAILDVVLDIRLESPTYGQCFSIELQAVSGETLFIPKGLAHGFKALENNTIVEYNQTTGYEPDCDFGIRYDSFGFDWDCVHEPIVSDRDKCFVPFDQYKSPF